MGEVTFRPIDRWPGEQTKRRQRSRFDSAWGDTLELMQRELRHLRAKGVVVLLALGEDDIRLDGRPRANARPEHPGVILAFDSPYGPLKYPCDTFTTWQDNFRAIALALEALRKVDRYGVTKRGEQYTGWRALPGPSGEATTVEQAARILASESGRSAEAIQGDAREAGLAIRKALMEAHPDRGGSPDRFHAVQTARRVIEEAHT